MSGYVEGILVLLAINVILAYAAALPLAGGQLNLGIAGFMAIGAYTSAYLSNEFALSLWLTIASGSLVAGLVALAIGLPILRAHGIYLALATFSLGEIIKAIFLNMDVVGGASGYAVLAYLESTAVWSIAAGVFLVMVFISQTRFFLYLTAIKNDATVTDLFGVNTKGIQLASFVLGACVAGIAGGVFAHLFSFVDAQYFSAQLNIFIALFVLLGGVQTILGPMFGALFFTLLPEILRFSNEWRFAVFAAVIILFMALRPEGVITSQLLRSIWRRRSVA
ncbi:MAG: branched-chain amino acid ABC transporter permease [Pseudomonadota bacterium]